LRDKRETKLDMVNSKLNFNVMDSKYLSDLVNNKFANLTVHDDEDYKNLKLTNKPSFETSESLSKNNSNKDKEKENKISKNIHSTSNNLNNKNNNNFSHTFNDTQQFPLEVKRHIDLKLNDRNENLGKDKDDGKLETIKNINE